MLKKTMSDQLASTYGAWLISLFVETILYGMGALQTWLYFQWWPRDKRHIKAPVLIVIALETIQIVFFFRSSYFRFVQRFGIPQGDLVWSDSLQLLANYLSAFTVQIYFAGRIYRLTKELITYKPSRLGIYVIMALAFIQLSAGITQTIFTYVLRSFEKLEKTKPITTIQTAASLACDVGITLYLCVYLHRHKNGMSMINSMLNTLIIYAINRGALTTISSGLTMGLFLWKPDSFWFFLALAPNSKLYMNSMLATLNTRQHVRDKANSNDHSLHMETLHSGGSRSINIQGPQSVSAVTFKTDSLNNVELGGKKSEFLAGE
ncbi:hypothetical protein B0H10DRAFT_62909 [Mycena sp. CBHHK59/15]|nr:hypothetical protein B0H10DRAFT_62909 [Mycena sp. CBHHK59/15]